MQTQRLLLSKLFQNNAVQIITFIIRYEETSYKEYFKSNWFKGCLRTVEQKQPRKTQNNDKSSQSIAVGKAWRNYSIHFPASFIISHSSLY